MKDGHLRCQGKENMKKTDISSFYQQMFDVGAEADDDGGVDREGGAMNVAVVEQAQKAAPRRCQKSGKKSSETEVKETEPRMKRGRGAKKAAEEEPEKKDNADNAARKVAPKKRGRKTAATVANTEVEEDTEKEPDAKRGRKAAAAKEEEKKTTEEVPEEKKADEAPEEAVLEPEVSTSTR